MIKLDSKNEKTRISYFISELILSDLKSNMIKSGYDLKGKSKWICEAVHELLTMTNYKELVMLNDQMQGFEKLDSISVDISFKTIITDAIINIRTDYPSLEGVQSKILRTAILQRLIRT